MFNKNQTLFNESMEGLNWHDTPIYSILFPQKNVIVLDIDYIQQWIQPEHDEVFFKFLLSPAKLKFEFVYSFILDIDSFLGELIAIDTFSICKTAEDLWKCSVICHRG